MYIWFRTQPSIPGAQSGACGSAVLARCVPGSGQNRRRTSTLQQQSPATIRVGYDRPCGKPKQRAYLETRHHHLLGGLNSVVPTPSRSGLILTTSAVGGGAATGSSIERHKRLLERSDDNIPQPDAARAQRQDRSRWHNNSSDTIPEEPVLERRVHRPVHNITLSTRQQAFAQCETHGAVPNEKPPRDTPGRRCLGS